MQRPTEARLLFSLQTFTIFFLNKRVY